MKDLFRARGFCDPRLPRAYLVAVTGYADYDEDPDVDPAVFCEVALNSRDEETYVEFGLEQLDAFIAALREARNHLAGDKQAAFPAEDAWVGGASPVPRLAGDPQ